MDVFPHPPSSEHSSPHPLQPHPTCTPLIDSFHLPVLYMWFLQARCGLLFITINHNHAAHLQGKSIPLVTQLRLSNHFSKFRKN